MPVWRAAGRVDRLSRAATATGRTVAQAACGPPVERSICLIAPR